MTHTTEQECTEFEAAFIAEKLRLMGGGGSEAERVIRAIHLMRSDGKDYDSSEARAAWWAWQAASRAPVVELQLRDAAQAVVERWDSPNWKDLPATGDYIAALRNALAAAPQPPEAATSGAGPEVSAAAPEVACNPSMQPELATNAAPVVPQGWQDLAKRCLVAMEGAIQFRKTGEGRPPEQTCLFEIEELRALLAAASQPPEAERRQAPALTPERQQMHKAMCVNASLGAAAQRWPEPAQPPEDAIPSLMELVDTFGTECSLRRAASLQQNYRLERDFRESAQDLRGQIEQKARELQAGAVCAVEADHGQ